MRNALRFVLSLVLVLVPFTALAEKEEKHSTEEISYERDFVAGPFGQVHIVTVQPVNDVELKTPLVLFHPTPYSSDYFKSFISHMARDRVVIAIDTPGYGDSDQPSSLQSIEGYAQSAATVLKALGYGKGRSVDALGYHTGSLIAAELAALNSDLVRRLVLPGVPFYVDEGVQREAYEKYVKASSITEDGSHLSGPWDFATLTREAGVSLERSQAHFNDYMQCYPDCWRAYHGVFSYDGKKRFVEVTQPVLLMSFPGSLDQETKDAGDFLQNAAHMRFDDIERGGFDLAPQRIAKATREFLDQ